MTYFVSLDIGSSFLKGAVFSSTLRVLGRLLTHKIPSTSPSLLPASLWGLCVQCMQELLSPLDIKEEDTLFLSISGNGPTLVYLGADDKVLACSLWNSSDFLVLHNEASYYLPFVEFMRRKKPDIFSELRQILPLAEYLSFLFCAKVATFVPHKQFVPYLWAEESIQKHQLPPSLFPPVQLTGTELGPMRPDIARLLGLTTNNARVLCGGLDYLSALVGSASVAVGDVCIRSGTSTVVNMCFDAQDTKRHLEEEPDHASFPSFVLPHPIEPCMNMGISMPFFHDLLQESSPALRYCAQDEKTTLSFWNFFSSPVGTLAGAPADSQADALESIESHKAKTLDALLRPFHDSLRDRLAVSFPQQGEAMQTSLSSLTLLLFLFKKIFLRFTKQLDKKNNHLRTGHVSYSGRKTEHTLFYSYLASVLQTEIRLYETEYCELRGNIIFALAQQHKEHGLLHYAHAFALPTSSYLPI